MEQLLNVGLLPGTSETRATAKRTTQALLRDALLASSSEYDFVCRASRLIPSLGPESQFYPMLNGVSPTLYNWNQKKYIAIVFSSPSIKSPVNTFGHISIIATNNSVGDPEPDAIVLEFVATEEMNTINISRALFSNIHGSFRLKWFIEKQVEYDQKDRDIWCYTVNSLIQTPQGLLSDMTWIIDKPLDYNIVDKNCSQRLYQLMTTKKNFDSRLNRISVPLDDLKDLASAGWFMNRNKVLSTASKADMNDFQSDKLQKIRLVLHSSLTSDNPHLVEAKRNEALLIAQQIVQEKAQDKDDQFTTTGVQPERPLGDPTYFKRGPSIIFGGGTGGSPHADRSEALYFEFKVGSFDFLNADKYSFESSELSFLSIASTYSQGEFQLDKLTLFKLDATEVGTLSKSNFTKWSYLGWGNLIQFAPRGSSPSEGLFSFGSGRTVALNNSGSIQTAIRAVGAFGYSKSGQVLEPISSFTVHGAAVLDIKINPGSFPRLRYSLEWRALEKNSLYRTRQEMVIVPIEIDRKSFFINYKTYDNKYREIGFGLSIPLNILNK